MLGMQLQVLIMKPVLGVGLTQTSQLEPGGNCSSLLNIRCSGAPSHMDVCLTSCALASIPRNVLKVQSELEDSPVSLCAGDRSTWAQMNQADGMCYQPESHGGMANKYPSE